MVEVAEALAPYVGTSSPSFRGIRNTSTGSGSQPSTMTALTRRRQRVPWRVAAGAAALVLVGVGLVGLAAGWFRPSGQPLAQDLEPGPAGPGNEAPKPVDDPNVLTVSQDPKYGARFSTIGEALDAVKLGQTVRVLDESVYREALTIKGSTVPAGVTLDAARGAVLESVPPGNILQVVDARGLTIRGFHLRAKNAPRTVLVMVRGRCPGLRLEGLELSSDSRATNGIELHGGTDPDTDREPLVIRGCTFRRLGLAADLTGADPDTLARVALRDCLFVDCVIGAKVTGRADRVQVVGNRF
jgi:hypothetical protein